jgi:hypothetical protein
VKRDGWTTDTERKVSQSDFGGGSRDGNNKDKDGKDVTVTLTTTTKPKTINTGELICLSSFSVFSFMLSALNLL